MRNTIAITIGDINGVGIHILLDLWKNNKFKDFILFTDFNEVKKILIKYKLLSAVNIINLKKNSFYIENKINIYNYKSLSSEDNTYKSLNFAYKYMLITQPTS